MYGKALDEAMDFVRRTHTRVRMEFWVRFTAFHIGASLGEHCRSHAVRLMLCITELIWPYTKTQSNSSQRFLGSGHVDYRARIEND